MSIVTGVCIRPGVGEWREPLSQYEAMELLNDGIHALVLTRGREVVECQGLHGAWWDAERERFIAPMEPSTRACKPLVPQ
jgi:hypothetical protein